MRRGSGEEAEPSIDEQKRSPVGTVEHTDPLNGCLNMDRFVTGCQNLPDDEMSHE